MIGGGGEEVEAEYWLVNGVFGKHPWRSPSRLKEEYLINFVPDLFWALLERDLETSHGNLLVYAEAVYKFIFKLLLRIDNELLVSEIQKNGGHRLHSRDRACEKIPWFTLKLAQVTQFLV